MSLTWKSARSFYWLNTKSLHENYCKCGRRVISNREVRQFWMKIHICTSLTDVDIVRIPLDAANIDNSPSFKIGPNDSWVVWRNGVSHERYWPWYSRSEASAGLPLQNLPFHGLSDATGWAASATDRCTAVLKPLQDFLCRIFRSTGWVTQRGEPRALLTVVQPFWSLCRTSSAESSANAYTKMLHFPNGKVSVIKTWATISTNMFPLSYPLLGVRRLKIISEA
jgi:hypothetical protein